jgi:arsenate reductase-like glutaredoxin family protein
MEDFGSISRTFNNLTNLILDAVQVSAMKVWAIVPSMLTNPESLASGIYPNKMFQLEDGVDPKMFMHSVDMGTLSADAVQVWQTLKGELSEAADINEIGLGQFAPKGRTSATEVSTTQESSSALIRSIAQTVEGRFLNPILNLTWQTGLQFAKKDDPLLSRACTSPDLYNALVAQKAELLKRPVTFQANGISMLIQKQRMIKNLMQLTQYMAADQQLLAAFMQKVDLEKYIQLLFHLSDIDLSKIAVSERQRLMQQVAQPMQQAAQAAGPPPEPGGAPAQEANQMTQALGVAQQ